MNLWPLYVLEYSWLFEVLMALMKDYYSSPWAKLKHPVTIRAKHTIRIHFSVHCNLLVADHY